MICVCGFGVSVLGGLLECLPAGGVRLDLPDDCLPGRRFDLREEGRGHLCEWVELLMHFGHIEGKLSYCFLVQQAHRNLPIRLRSHRATWLQGFGFVVRSR